MRRQALLERPIDPLHDRVDLRTRARHALRERLGLRLDPRVLAVDRGIGGECGGVLLRRHDRTRPAHARDARLTGPDGLDDLRGVARQDDAFLQVDLEHEPLDRKRAPERDGRRQPATCYVEPDDATSCDHRVLELEHEPGAEPELEHVAVLGHLRRRRNPHRREAHREHIEDLLDPRAHDLFEPLELGHDRLIRLALPVPHARAALLADLERGRIRRHRHELPEKRVLGLAQYADGLRLVVHRPLDAHALGRRNPAPDIMKAHRLLDVARLAQRRAGRVVVEADLRRLELVRAPAARHFHFELEPHRELAGLARRTPPVPHARVTDLLAEHVDAEERLAPELGDRPFEAGIDRQLLLHRHASVGRGAPACDGRALGGRDDERRLGPATCHKRTADEPHDELPLHSMTPGSRARPLTRSERNCMRDRRHELSPPKPRSRTVRRGSAWGTRGACDRRTAVPMSRGSSGTPRNNWYN